MFTVSDKQKRSEGIRGAGGSACGHGRWSEDIVRYNLLPQLGRLSPPGSEGLTLVTTDKPSPENTECTEAGSEIATVDLVRGWHSEWCDDERLALDVY